MPDIIACICEGSAERAILERLLEWGCLVFTRDDLLDRQLLDGIYRSPRNFERDYLSKYFDGSKIKIYRIIDSLKEGTEYKLSKEYIPLLNLVNAITNPEIEMIYIISEGYFNEFNQKYKGGKNKLKPSEYVREIMRVKNVKKFDFIYNYFDEKDKLISALKTYAKGKTNTIYDLVKECCK
jgi:hypothetical protein